MPIYEPGLAELVAKNVRERRLSFTTSLAEAVEDAAAVFIAVGTPSRPADGLADLTYVYQAAREIAAVLRRLCRDRDQVDGPGRHRRRDRSASSPTSSRTPTSRWSPTRSSCARARRSPISWRPTASSSAPTMTRAREVMDELYRPLAEKQAPILFTAAARRRAHQVRRQRVPGHQDHLHQRDRGPVRAGRRRRSRRWRTASASTTGSGRSS